MDYTGTIIEESLENKNSFSDIKILSTKVEQVTERHKTPWLKQWTLHKVEIPENRASDIAEQLSKNLDSKHSSWYVDFKNETNHFIIFPNRVFKINRTSKEQYDEATKYGVSLGIPDYQVDFSPHVKKWGK